MKGNALKFKKELYYDVVIAGGGTSGVIAAIAAGRMGEKVLLVERLDILGGELTTGLQICSTKNAIGEWILGGIPMEIINKCKKIDKFTKCVFDWRLMWAYEVDPILLQMIIVDTLREAKVDVLLHTIVTDVITKNNEVKALVATDGFSNFIIHGKRFVDTTGDGGIAVKSGAMFDFSNIKGEIQPISIIFRMNNINIRRLLEFILKHPKDIMLAESPIIKKTREECAEEIFKGGYPIAGLDAKGPLLQKAIDSGEMFETMGIYIMPVALSRNEIALNSTRIANIDATRSDQISSKLPELYFQIDNCASFLNRNIKGFEKAKICAIASKIGIRETRRIIGEYILTEDDVLSSRKFDDVVAKGGDHIDIHGSGRIQRRTPIPNGGSYDIPYRCLIPKKIENLIIAGRCISADREANATMRSMGSCMATGQAAGVASVLSLRYNIFPRNLIYEKLGSELEKQGVILKGTK